MCTEQSSNDHGCVPTYIAQLSSLDNQDSQHPRPLLNSLVISVRLHHTDGAFDHSVLLRAFDLGIDGGGNERWSLVHPSDLVPTTGRFPSDVRAV
jgi:hypothetical protein